MSEGYGLYIHHNSKYLLGRTTKITFNNKVKTIQNNSVTIYTDKHLRCLGWLKVSPIILAGWRDDK